MRDKLNINQIIGLALSGLLLLGTLDLPNGYYQFLRIAVTIGAIFYAAILSRKKFIVLPVLFTGIAILFNPLFPVQLDKNIWSLLDLAIAFFFAGVAYRALKTEVKKV